MIRVLKTGHTTVQDLGRVGFASAGVPRSGAMDPWLLRAANRLCGNPDDAAGLEVALGSLELAFETEATIAAVGFGGISVNGAPADTRRPIVVSAGAAVRARHGGTAAFGYLCVSGGLRTPVVLESRSTLASAGIGCVLRTGDELPIESGGAGGRRLAGESPFSGSVARIVRGPHHEAFTQDAFDSLTGEEFTVAMRSDRTGRRLDGRRLAHEGPGEIDPAGMIPGVIQVPPDGAPIVLGPDGPVTGGYPVIATVIAADLGIVMQAPPGRAIHFVAAGVDQARAAWLERERMLDQYVIDG